ncbi:MAG: hypothetical protein HY456_00920 [Parcubacteria group bacterium]|nr:hypothetical protein [Parcubacteria group bacterium]
MYNFILQTVIFLSFGVIVYLVARALPRVSGEDTHQPPKPSLLDSILMPVTLERADAFLNAILEKILRRLKILVMKADNFVTGRLGALKSSSYVRTGEDKQNGPSAQADSNGKDLL